MSVVQIRATAKSPCRSFCQRKSSTAASSENSNIANSKRIVCLTACDYPTARLLDEAGVDVILVGDSPRYGRPRLRQHAASNPRRNDPSRQSGPARPPSAPSWSQTCPSAAYHSDTAESLRNAVRFVKEAGVEAVKVEGGERRLELIRAPNRRPKIPVMGHIGLTPQSSTRSAGYLLARQDHRWPRAIAPRRPGRGSRRCLRQIVSRGRAPANSRAITARAAHPDYRHRGRPGLRRVQITRSPRHARAHL